MSVSMDDIPYTVSELAGCAGAANLQQKDLYLRRLRHWSTAGVLDTLGAQHVGTGRARRYGSEQAYIAAVLLRLADWGLSIGILKAVAKVIAIEKAKGEEISKLWEEAKRPKPFASGCVFMGLTIAVEDEPEKERISVGIRLVHGNGISTPSFYLDREDSIIVLNLTEIFARVRL
jgi:hypothetical protein